MKLILCPACQDVVKAGLRETRFCQCGKSWGKYRDPLNAEYGGEAIPLGLLNNELRLAVLGQPQAGLGAQFTAFVIPKECPTYKKVPK